MDKVVYNFEKYVFICACYIGAKVLQSIYLSYNISTSNEEADYFCATNDYTAENACFSELDVPISQKEIRDAVKKLKRNKANVSDFFK